MIINHNIAAMNTLNALSTNESSTTKSLAKLSSGYKINSAADDAAGLEISEKMRGQIHGLDKAKSNSQDGISLTQTAEGALSETTSILQRMRELSVQASNDTTTNSDRTAAQDEVTQLNDEIDTIANTTQFNTKNLLDGSLAKGTSSQGTILNSVGTSNGTAVSDASTALTDLADSNKNSFGLAAGDIITISGDINGSAVTAATSSAAGATTTPPVAAGNVNGSAVATVAAGNANGSAVTTTPPAAGATATPSDVNDSAVAVTHTVAAGDTLATLANSIQGAFTGSTVSIDKTTGAIKINGAGGTAHAISNLKITATDSNGIKRDLLSNAFSSMKETQAAQDTHTDSSLTFQIGANQGQTMNIDINKMDTKALSLASINISTKQGASNAISIVDDAINKVSVERAKLGAYENRLDHTINNLTTSSENLTTAESNIRDVDMAKEMTNYQKANVLQQAAQSMLAQANQQPQQVLSLLK